MRSCLKSTCMSIREVIISKGELLVSKYRPMTVNIRETDDYYEIIEEYRNLFSRT